MSSEEKIKAESAPTMIVAIRCSRQKYADLKLELNLRWTVLDLKRHLTEMHPSKSPISRQRLIFAGQLMKDEVTVAQYVNRLPSTDDHLPIIHFVYSPDVNDLASDSPSSLRQRKPVQTGTATQPAHLHAASSSNLFYAAAAAANNNAPAANNAASTIFPWIQSSPNFINAAVQQQSAAQASTTLLHPHAAVNAMYAMNQQYYQYLQQVYGQAAYNFNWAPYGHQSPHQFAPSMSAAMAPQAVAAPQAVLQQPQVNVANNDNNGGLLIGEAGGVGPAAAVAAAGGPGGRDLLDLLYMALRSLFLLVVLFSYSSMERTAFVMFVCFLLFAYHNGWFARRGGGAAAQRNNNVNNAAQQQAAAAVAAGLVADNNNNNERAQGVGAAEATVNPAQQQQQMDQSEGSAWHVFWSTCYTFISSFFASLIPERPPPPANF